jgi:hypothetical protein
MERALPEIDRRDRGGEDAVPQRRRRPTYLARFGVPQNAAAPGKVFADWLEPLLKEKLFA